MKKLVTVFVLMVSLFVLSACGNTEKVDYTPGVYYASTGGNQGSIGVLVVDENGLLDTIIIDTVYLKSDATGNVSWPGYGGAETGIATTKLSLEEGWGYKMHWSGYAATDTTPTMAEYKTWLSAQGKLEWFQQVDLVIAKVIKDQGFTADSRIGKEFESEVAADAKSGASITTTDYYTVIEALLAQARK